MAARGFLENEIWMWMLPDDRRRMRVMRRQYRSLIRHVFIPRRSAWTTGEGGGTALWYPPGTTDLNFRESMAEMLPILPEGLFRLRKISRFEREVKANWPDEPHWYLAVLSVHPGGQGKGHGGSLMRAGLERVDADGVGAYLETQRERNVGFYEQFGFRLTGKFEVDGQPMWLMWREPRGTETAS